MMFNTIVSLLELVRYPILKSNTGLKDKTFKMTLFQGYREDLSSTISKIQKYTLQYN